MASRTRVRTVRYGGWKAGTLNGTDLPEPAIVGLHSCFDEVHPGPPYRTGGPLLVQKKKVSYDRTTSFYASTLFGPVQTWNGHLVPEAYVPGTEPYPLNLSGWGAKGWNRAFPIHPIYNLGVSLAEIRDLPRMLSHTWGLFKGIRNISFTKKPGTVGGFLASLGEGISDAAGDYLNLQFGWVPALQDLNFLLSMQNKLAKKIAWLRRHNGKSVRRNFEMDATGFSESVDRFTYPYVTMKPTLTTELYKGFLFDYQNIPVQKTYSRRIWFRSKWRFYIPELAEDGVLTKALKFNLVGLALDPSVVYKATPWSWLLDWFVSVGAVIQNIYLRLRFQCVAEYAYVLCSENYQYDAPGFTEVNTGKQHFDQNFNVVWPGSLKLSGVSKTYYEFRQREEANPYGFGITFSSLSAYQWSILAALGLTRGGKSFATRT